MGDPETRADVVGQPGTDAAGCVGKAVASIFFLLFLGIGLLFEVLVVSTTAQELRVRWWPTAPCEILSSEIKTLEDGRYKLEVQYRYAAGGGERTGYRLAYRSAVRDTYSEAQEDALRHPAGSHGTCLVNPADPSFAVLEAPPVWIVLIALFPLIFVAVGLGGLVFVWRRRKPKLRPNGTPVPKALTSAAGKKGVPRWAMGLFSGVFLLVGLGAFCALGVRPALKLLDAREWREVECRVLSSEVRSHRSDDSTTYSVYILYAYEVGGREFRSDRYDFMGGSSSGYDSKAEVVAQYPAGGRARCFVDPEAPGEAVLDRDFRAVYLIGLLPLLFVVAGLVGLLFALRKDSAPRDVSAGPDVGGVTYREVEETWRAEEGAVVLKSRGTPAGKFIALVLIALFWNGIVSIFVWQVVAGFRKGDPDWALTLFISLFVFVGLILVGAGVYQFLALFNPRVHITLQTSPARLGTPEGVAWEVKGNVGRLARLTLTCEGREEATYRRGTRTCTDKSVFARIVIADLGRGGQLAQGRTDLTIPGGLVPTFSAPNNKILWSLKVHGEVPHWPDVSEEFELTVLPAGGAP